MFIFFLFQPFLVDTDIYRRRPSWVRKRRWRRLRMGVQLLWRSLSSVLGVPEISRIFIAPSPCQFSLKATWREERTKKVGGFLWNMGNNCLTIASASGSNDQTGSSRRNYLALTDEELMRQCEMGTFKTSGPGGQHRNKRESAVRLKHLPTSIIAQASEDRSQHKNRASALSRLRTLLALKGLPTIPYSMHFFS